MIPKIIHYCWFGRGPMPQLALDCIDSWHKYMPDWKYILWNEDNFDINSISYTREAYDAKKYAFVSDYARLVALKQYGGLYLDTDILVFKPFDSLLEFHAFTGFEGSKHSPVMGAIMATEPEGEWVSEQLAEYQGLHFINEDGSYNMLTNTLRITYRMLKDGFVANGKEQDYKDLHVFPVDYFSPRHTTGEYIKTDNTFCDHIGVCAWDNNKKPLITRMLGQRLTTKLIKLKRRITISK